MPVTQIALETGYETPSAFAKAYKQFYGLTPSETRSCARRGETIYYYPISCGLRDKPRDTRLQATIRKLPDQQVLYARAYGLKNGAFNEAAKQGYETLFAYIHQHGLQDQWTLCLGITPDEPTSVPPEQCRFDAGVVLKPGVQVELNGDQSIGLQIVQAGRFATFVHQGPYAMLWQTWNAIYQDWLPGSGETLRAAPPYDLYLNDPAKVQPGELLTEIHIPIR
jgi:AraC family transcriptional regulator